MVRHATLAARKGTIYVEYYSGLPFKIDGMTT